MTDKTSYSIRLPRPVIEKLKKIAREKYLPSSVMVRSWVMERLEEYEHEKEQKAKQEG